MAGIYRIPTAQIMKNLKQAIKNRKQFNRDTFTLDVETYDELAETMYQAVDDTLAELEETIDMP